MNQTLGVVLRPVGLAGERAGMTPGLLTRGHGWIACNVEEDQGLFEVELGVEHRRR